MSAPELRPIVQVAYRVQDLRRAAEEFSRLTGAGPFFVMEHVAMQWLRHPSAAATDAQDAVVDHSIAIGQWGPVQVELVEHHQLAPAAVEAAFTGTGYGLHHVAWFADDLDAECARLVQEGATPVVEGSTGPTRFAFLQSPNGAILECYQKADPILNVYAMVRQAAEGWDGTEPVRDMPRR